MDNILDIELAHKISAILLQSKAIKLNVANPYVWASGWKSPFYCDNRRTLGYVSARTAIRDGLIKIVKNYYKDAEVVAGVATGAIAQGVLIADGLGLPYVYVRPKAKDHGLKNQIEGIEVAGKKVVVIEDLISTGSSSLSAVSVLREAGAEVIGMAAIYTYGFQTAVDNFKAADCKLITLTNYKAVLEAALKEGYISQDMLPTLDAWQSDPAHWGE